jgi:hypothetical protein
MFRVTLIPLFFLISFFGISGKIEKGYSSLKVYNYFKAKALFEKSFKRNPSPAAYGLSIIYFRNDNPFHNIDSALRYIQIAERGFKDVDDKKKEKWRAFGFEYLSILELRNNISTQHFARVESQSSENAYNEFMKIHPWAGEFDIAHYRRDSIAFTSSYESGKSIEMRAFMERYPDSEFYNKAQEEFYKLQYHEVTVSGTISSYLEFLKSHPSNPFTKEAEDRIYEIVTGPNSIPSLEVFVKTYSKNRNVGEAWRRIYQMFMSDYSQQRFDEFKEAYPEFPYTEELETDYMYSKRELLPFMSDGKYGYFDYTGEVIIQPEYDYAAFFKEGLAVVMKNDRFGFIDKGNRVVIPIQYDNALDFDQGRAVVEKEEKLGMIDRNGVVIFDFEYEDLGTLNEGLVYASMEGFYGYYDKNANLRIKHQFEEAFSFQDGKAKVVLNEKEAFIDIYGTFEVPAGYADIRFFNDSLLVYELDGDYGLMRKNCSIFLDAQFQEIGELQNGRALIVQDDYIGYLNDKGEIVIPPKFELFPNYQDKGAFSSKNAVVKLKGKFGMIDLNGKFAIPNVYADLGAFSSRIAFSKGKGWGFIDPAGKEVLKPAYDYAESFLQGHAIIELAGQQGVIDQKGSVILPIEYGSIVDIEEKYWMVSRLGQYGLANKKGELIVPLEYNKIIKADDIFILVKKEEIHYFYEKENRIIKQKELNE